MNKLLLIILLGVFLTSCGGSQKTVVDSRTKTAKKVTRSINSKLDNVIEVAASYVGTKYKYGGTTKKGMDCSGLVFTAFQKEQIALPRVSRDMATKGKRIKLNQAQEGDLVFFQTNKNRKVINHVGLVNSTKGGKVSFIHSTTSRGVIVSTLDESYWKNAFVEIRRII